MHLDRGVDRDRSVRRCSGCAGRGRARLVEAARGARVAARPARGRQAGSRRLRGLAPGAIDDLHRAVDEVAAGLSRVDRRVDTAVSKTSLVRYDAYEGAGGHQSASIALLDAGRSGVILTAIQGRDYARIYVKELDHGRPSVALSPEEEQAVERAMAG